MLKPRVGGYRLRGKNGPYEWVITRCFVTGTIIATGQDDIAQEQSMERYPFDSLQRK